MQDSCIPEASDYDGDGLADLVVYRSGTGTWYGISSSDPSDYGSLQWGLPTDVPISALYRIRK